ncbi:MAG: hypothetical protein KF748_16570 [Xanthobacteraceae bacterium]|nr:hypothetical protein [Xanthobacteraceae bacterium]
MSADPAFSGERPLLPALAPHLERGESVRWTGRPSARSILRTKSVLWWIGVPWLAFVLSAYFLGWIDWMALVPLGMVGAALVAAPFIMVFDSGKTVYAITNRRALIVHDGMKPRFVTTPLSKMDETLEVIETGSGAGHVYFSSGRSTKLPDTDYTGKLAFRDVANAREIAKILDAARRR